MQGTDPIGTTFVGMTYNGAQKNNGCILFENPFFCIGIIGVICKSSVCELYITTYTYAVFSVAW